MLNNRRAVFSCEYGCCAVRERNRTLRSREKRRWKYDYKGET